MPTIINLKSHRQYADPNIATFIVYLEGDFATWNNQLGTLTCTVTHGLAVPDGNAVGIAQGGTSDFILQGSIGRQNIDPGVFSTNEYRYYFDTPANQQPVIGAPLINAPPQTRRVRLGFAYMDQQNKPVV